MSANGSATWARPRPEPATNVRRAMTATRGRRLEAAVAVAIGLGRQMTFCIVALAVFIVAVYVLREILLPFVVGMALAYLFNPLASRLERLGVGRLVASLLAIATFVLSFIVLILLIAPILVGQLAAFIDKIPEYAGK